MLDIGWTELLVIGALALIVVGPKDLPGMLRNAGRFVAKARGMAREFQGAMEDAARQADLGDVADLKRDVSKWSGGFNPASPSNLAKSLLDGDDDKPKKPEPGSLDAADDAENAAWESEQAARAEAAAAESRASDSADALAQAEAEAKAAELRLAEARAEAEAARLSKVNSSAAELEAELAREEEAERPRPATPGA